MSREIEDFLEEIISSYETRITKIESVFQTSENINETCHFLFDNVKNSLKEFRNERDILNIKLREKLAKNGSFRKKDYDVLMEDIVSTLEEKEKETLIEFLHYIEAQKEMAQVIKFSLLGIKEANFSQAKEKMSSVKLLLSKILKQQETRKRTLVNSFSDLQHLHNKMTGCLIGLLEKGDEIQVKDIKEIINKI